MNMLFFRDVGQKLFKLFQTKKVFVKIDNVANSFVYPGSEIFFGK